MDTPTVPLTGAMDILSASAYVRFLADLKEKVLKSGTDYGAATGNHSKPSLLKPGAEKVAKILGYRAQFEPIDHRMECDTGFVNFGYRCTLVNDKGEQVMQGEGYCNSHEPKYRWKWVSQPKPDKEIEDRMKAMGTGRNKQVNGKWTWQERSPADDTLGQANTISKIAQKRAFVAAVLFASGLSEFFTQDIEDMPRTDMDEEHIPQQPQPPSTKLVSKTEPPPPPPSSDPEKQPTGRDYAIIETIMRQVVQLSATAILQSASEIVQDGRNKGLTKNGVDELKRQVNEEVKEKREAMRRAADNRQNTTRR